jgi:hypothetical protein
MEFLSNEGEKKCSEELLKIMRQKLYSELQSEFSHEIETEMEHKIFEKVSNLIVTDLFVKFYREAIEENKNTLYTKLIEDLLNLVHEKAASSTIK